MKIRLCGVNDVEEGAILQGKMPDHAPFAVYHVNDSFYVTEDACTHGKESLADEGDLDGYGVTCTWHEGKFDIRTGAMLAAPCTQPVKSFAVTVEEAAVWVEVEAQAPGSWTRAQLDCQTYRETLMAERAVTFDDKYTQKSGRIFLSARARVCSEEFRHAKRPARATYVRLLMRNTSRRR